MNLLDALLTPRQRWRLKQALAGESRYYGDGGTIHAARRLDVEVHDGQVVAVWFRCQLLPFRQSDVSLTRATEIRGHEPGVVITGVEVKER